MEKLDLGEAQTQLDEVTSLLRTWSRTAESDSVRWQNQRAHDLKQSGEQLSFLVEKMPEEKALLFTIGHRAVHASDFHRGAYDFLVESNFTLGSQWYVGPRPSLALTRTQWITNALIGNRRPYFGDYGLVVDLVQIAGALTDDGTINIVDRPLAEAVSSRRY